MVITYAKMSIHNRIIFCPSDGKFFDPVSYWSLSVKCKKMRDFVLLQLFSIGDSLKKQTVARFALVDGAGPRSVQMYCFPRLRVGQHHYKSVAYHVAFWSGRIQDIRSLH